MGQHDRLYKTYQWKLRRNSQLQQHPLCHQCMTVHQRVTAATIVHHAVPHNGDRNLFFYGALVSLCKQCHDSDMQAIEKGGVPRPIIGIDGWPK
jgi:5-methylcytosine-specific restriction enzyme A